MTLGPMSSNGTWGPLGRGSWNHLGSRNTPSHTPPLLPNRDLTAKEGFIKVLKGLLWALFWMRGVLAGGSIEILDSSTDSDLAAALGECGDDHGSSVSVEKGLWACYQEPPMYLYEGSHGLY